jgi:hypothetical protein
MDVDAISLEPARAARIKSKRPSPPRRALSLLLIFPPQTVAHPRPHIFSASSRTRPKAQVSHFLSIPKPIPNGTKESRSAQGESQRLRSSPACFLPRYVLSLSTNLSQPVRSAWDAFAEYLLTHFRRHGQGGHRQRELFSPAHCARRRRSQCLIMRPTLQRAILSPPLLRIGFANV